MDLAKAVGAMAVILAVLLVTGYAVGHEEQAPEATSAVKRS